MSWTIFKINVLKSMVTFQFGKDSDSFAEFYANEYDKCMKRGGDMIYGVPVINGNVVGMANVIKRAFKKGQASGGENFNILQEICPAAFDAYWLGAEMSPLPNPLLRPLGWQSTPPAPSTILNIGPNPIALAKSIVLNAAEVAATKILVEALKEQIVNIAGVGNINVYDTIQKILKKEKIDEKISKHPAIIAGKLLVEKYNQAKKKKPSIGSQFKKSIKIPFPELPKRKKIIEKLTAKLLDEAMEQLKEQLIIPIEEIILAPIISYVQTVVEISNNIPNPKPTKEQIKQYLKDTINGVIPEIQLPNINIPKIPTKEEFQKMIDEKIPTKEELMATALELINGKIPNIPNIHFIRPTLQFSFQTNALINPFVNLAKTHLLGVGGVMTVMAQYPPPSPPAPAIINWNGYKIIG